jgi:hypothetical protein
MSEGRISPSMGAHGPFEGRSGPFEFRSAKAGSRSGGGARGAPYFGGFAGRISTRLGRACGG